MSRDDDELLARLALIVALALACFILGRIA